MVICNFNDPTGHYVPAEELGALLAALPDDVYLLLDEALVHFQDAEPVDACLRLVDASLACSWCARSRRPGACPGCGYAVGLDPALLAAVAPNLGVNALTQAAVEHALRTGEDEIERRRAAVSRERALLTADLRALGLDVTDPQANFVWMAACSARRRAGPGAAPPGRDRGPGGPLGADDHARAAVLGEPARIRLTRAVELALG